MKKNKTVIEKYKSMSFGDAAEKIGKKYPNRSTDLIQKNSFEAELNQLAKHQEKVKLVSQAKEAMNKFGKGGKLKYGSGGPFKDVSGDPNVINNSPYGQISYPNTYAEPNPNDIKPLPSLPTPPLGQNGPPAPFTRQVNIPYSGAGKLPVTAAPPSTDIQFPDLNKLVGDPTVPFKPDDQPAQVDKTGSREASAYTPAIVGGAISTAINTGILAGGYDKVAPVDNPYEQRVKNLLGRRRIDTTQQRNQIQSVYNASSKNLSNVRSANLKNALDANLMSKTQDSLASSKLNEQIANQGFKADYARALDSLGQQKVHAQTYSEDVTARNKGQYQSNVSAFGTAIADNLKFFTKNKLNTIQNKLLGDILNNKYSFGGLNPDVAARLSEGKTTQEDIVVLNSMLGKTITDQLVKGFEIK